MSSSRSRASISSMAGILRGRLLALHRKANLSRGIAGCRQVDSPSMEDLGHHARQGPAARCLPLEWLLGVLAEVRLLVVSEPAAALVAVRSIGWEDVESKATAIAAGDGAAPEPMRAAIRPALD